MFSPILATTGGGSGVGTGSGVAVATGSAVGASLFTAAGTGIAVATGTAVGASLFTGAGTANAIATGAAVGQAIIIAIGNGIAVVTGLGIGDWTHTLILSAAQGIRMDAIFRRHGLIAPLVITPTSIGDGTLTMTRSWDGTTETDTVTALPTVGAPTAALVDKLARHYGLYDPIGVTATGRTDGTLTQTFVQVGDDITITTL